jgi:FKBP-type peptidyl-prolyl cis-trans isomerase
MKKLLAMSLGTLALAACQPATSDNAEIKALRADVDALKLEVFGDPLAQCPQDKWLEGIDAYAATLEGLPDAELEPEAWHTSNGAREGVETTDSGLQYTVVQTGNANAPSPVGGQIVTVNYHGIFPNGDKFDSSYDRSEPSEFPANRVIRGWVEALQDMKPCEARTLYIPGDLAYGEQGRPGIPSNATLVFHVQLLGIDQKS